MPRGSFLTSSIKNEIIGKFYQHIFIQYLTNFIMLVIKKAYKNRAENNIFFSLKIKVFNCIF